MSAQCPKCGSKNTYEIGRDYGCRMCGKQFPKEGVTPIIVNKVAYERKKTMPEEIKKYPSGKTGICVNCRRSVWIADKFGRCKVCSDAVKNIPEGCEANIIAALAAAKARLTGKKQKQRTTTTAPQFVKRGGTKKTQSTLDMTVKEVALTGIPKIIQ